jgi:hypothetical protein
MRAAISTILLVAMAATAACQQERSDQNIAIDNNMAGADIEALPADESSATSTEELENGVDTPVSNDVANFTNSQ